MTAILRSLWLSVLLAIGHLFAAMFGVEAT